MKLALALCAVLAVTPAFARTPLQAYLEALDAEVVRGELARALELYREAGKSPATELKVNAEIGQARVLLHQEDLRSFAQMLTSLPPARALTPGQAAEVTRLRHARDEQLREPKRSPPPPPPPHATHDVSLSDQGLEDAALALSNLYGVTIVAAEVVAQPVHLHLKAVTLHQALLALAFHTGLDVRLAAHVYYLGSRRKLDATLQPLAARPVAQLFAAEAVPRPITPAPSISLELTEVPVAEVVRRLVDGFGVNVVAAGAPQKVSLEMQRVGLDGALRSLAGQLGWEIRRVNDMFFLGPGAHLAVYFPGFERRYLRMRHASAGEIYDQVQEFLGKEKLRLARTEVDIVGNALIIEGDKADLDKVERFLSLSDVAQQSVSLELWMKDYRAARPAESPHKRMRMLAGQMGIVTLEAEAATPTLGTTASTTQTAASPAPSPAPPPPPAQLQLMVELTPHLDASQTAGFDVSWRLTTLRAGATVDVKEAPPARVTTPLDASPEVPVLVGPDGKPLLALVLRRGD